MPTTDSTTIFEPIKNPLEKLSPDGQYYGGIDSDMGPLTLLSNIFQLIAVAAGLFALFNFIMAGMQYISSQGDPKGVEEAWKKIYMSFTGLAIIAIAFIVAAVIGQIFFGNATFIFKPKVYGPGSI